MLLCVTKESKRRLHITIPGQPWGIMGQSWDCQTVQLGLWMNTVLEPIRMHKLAPLDCTGRNPNTS
jgi:hypothetical protein